MGLYSGDLTFLFVVGHPLRHPCLAHSRNPYTYLFQSCLDFAGWPVTVSFITINFRRLFYYPLKFSKTIAVALMSTKPGSLPALVLSILTTVQNISKLAFLPSRKDYKSCVTGLPNMTEPMFAWNLPASIGFRFSISWRRIIFGLPFLIPNIHNL